MKATAEPATNIVEGLNLLKEKQIDISFSADSYNYWAPRGLQMFAGKPLSMWMLFSSDFSTKFAVFALADSGIKSIPDLRGRRFAGRQGATPALDLIRVAAFKNYGMADKDVTLLTYGDYNEASRMVKEGVADAAATIIDHPAPAIADLASVKSVRFIPLDKDKAEAMGEELKVYTPSFKQAGTYQGLDKDIMTVGDGVSWNVRGDFDADLAYAILKAVYDHEEEFYSMHSVARKSRALQTILRQ